METIRSARMLSTVLGLMSQARWDMVAFKITSETLVVRRTSPCPQLNDTPKNTRKPELAAATKPKSASGEFWLSRVSWRDV